MRAAVVGGGAYYAGKKMQQGKQRNAETEARLDDLEAQQGQAQAPPPPPPPAAAPPPPAPAAAPAPAAGGTDMVSQIQQLKELLDQGVLTQDEFEAAKQKLLAS